MIYRNQHFFQLNPIYDAKLMYIHIYIYCIYIYIYILVFLDECEQLQAGNEWDVPWVIADGSQTWQAGKSLSQAEAES